MNEHRRTDMGCMSRLVLICFTDCLLERLSLFIERHELKLMRLFGVSLGEGGPGRGGGLAWRGTSGSMPQDRYLDTYSGHLKT